MRIFVTGASGFVGARLFAYLREQGEEVAGSYCGEPPPADPALQQVDIEDPEATRQAIAEHRPDVVIHLAALSHVGASWARFGDYFRVNVIGTENVLRASSGARVLFASSSEVYGPVPEDEQPIDEERRLDPRNPYAMTKAAAERLAVNAGAVVVRSFSLVGPGQSCQFAMPAFAAQLAAIRRDGLPPTLKVGNLTARRDFVHVDDAVRALRLLAAEGSAGEFYNLGSGRALSIRELLERLLVIADVEAAVEVDPDRLRPIDLPLLVAGAGKLRALGWQPQLSVDQALRDLWEATLASAQAA